MGASIEARKEATKKRNQAWEMHINGLPHYVIAERLGITSPRVTQYIQQAAKEHPVNKLSMEERMAVSEGRWQLAEDAIRLQIAQQMQEGIITTEVVTAPDGKQTKTVTTRRGCDPALLRAWSTHSDRRARQVLNQNSPDTNVQQVNVSMVRDFLNQGDKPQARMTAAEWNDQAIDV